MQLKSNRILDRYLGYVLIAVLLPLTRLLGITLRRNHSLQRPPQHILFIKLLGLGSLVVASDPVKALKEKYPGAKFILLTDKNIGQGIAPFQVFDEIWAMDTTKGILKGSLKYLWASWRLRNLWVADLEVYSKLTTVFALLTLAKNRFGFRLFFRRYLNTHSVWFDQGDFLEDNYWRMMEAMAQGVERKHLTRTYETDKPYILLNNTCSELALTRKLPDETFAELCHWLLQHTHYKLAFLGAPKDKTTIDAFIDDRLHTQRHKLLNMAGAYDFESYYRFMKEKGAYLISIDSAPLHIARKLGLPTISIWGPTDPGNHLKIADGQSDVFLYSNLPCSPCVHRVEKLPCGGDNICMKNIRAESIIKMFQAQSIKTNSPVLIG